MAQEPMSYLNIINIPTCMPIPSLQAACSSPLLKRRTHLVNKMEGRMIAKRWRIAKPELRWWRLSRLMVTTKPYYRAAVHGTKPPVTHTINREEAEKEIARGKEEKEKKRKELEAAADSHLNQSDTPYTPLK